MIDLTRRVKEEALRLGFSRVGIAREVPKERLDFYDWWVAQGFGADMSWLARHSEKKRDWSLLVPGARSAVVCLLRYPGSSPPANPVSEPHGKLARYSVGEDYHHVLQPMLDRLANFLRQSGATAARGFVDSGPVAERSLGALAGLGWIGKNSMLIHPEEGSWFWIGEVITSLELAPDAPIADHCGKCRRCLDACPTQAILEDKRAVDSRRCLSWLTIENRGPIPEEFHSAMGSWILGCDICQEVCPWNDHSLRKARQEIGAPQPELVPLREIDELSGEDFQKRYRHRAAGRPKREGLQRNAVIARKNLDAPLPPKGSDT